MYNSEITLFENGGDDAEEFISEKNTLKNGERRTSLSHETTWENSDLRSTNEPYFPRPQWAQIVPADAVDGAAELAAGLTVEFRLRRHEGPRPVGDRAAARTEGGGGDR